jgi:hypothetical protein
MYQDINEYSFRDAFKRMGREDQFSYEGLGILFNELEQYEVDTGEKIELDVIGLCCDFSEHSEDEIKQYYSLDEEEEEDIDDYLNQNTWVLGMHEKDGKKYFIYRQF